MKSFIQKYVFHKGDRDNQVKLTLSDATFTALKCLAQKNGYKNVPSLIYDMLENELHEAVHDGDLVPPAGEESAFESTSRSNSKIA